jgi:uncharacterized protein
MDLDHRLATTSTNRPKTVVAIMLAATLGIAILAALPSIWPASASILSAVTVDTDPENMLRADEPVRILHRELKHKFDLNDMLVVGVVNEVNDDGVFNPETLKKVYEVTSFALTLHGAAIGAEAGEGVIGRDVIAPSTVDRIEPGEEGVISFSWLMRPTPETIEGAADVRRAAQRLPFLENTLVSGDGEAIAIYLPLTDKNLSYRVASQLEDKIASLGGPEEFHITGLPVAEDTFGVEMFIQMAISAPAAMLVIFLLMFLFFRKLTIILSPLILAMVSVIITMGTLVIFGHPVHIMSSMIPIFIMPIAVLDSVHIISEFFDRYQETRDRRKTIIHVIRTLFRPMLFTSLTSAAGFASLALTPIPPVQVFGIFVAIGIMVAWILTMVFVPAFVMLIPEGKLASFGVTRSDENAHGIMGRILSVMGRGAYRRAKPIVAIAVVVLIVAGVGIARINVNDNPVKWFHESHPIRVADRVLNEHFAGTYMAYLSFAAEDDREDAAGFVSAMRQEAERAGVERNVAAVFLAAAERVAGDSSPIAHDRLAETIRSKLGIISDPEGDLPDLSDEVPGIPAERGGDLPELPGGLGDIGADGEDEATLAASDGLTDSERSGWEKLLGSVEARRQRRSEVFKQPDVLRWMTRLQEHLLLSRSRHGLPVVGKSNSLSDIVCTVHRDLRQGQPEFYRIPDSFNAVGQCISQFENGHRPHDLAHFTMTGGPEAYRQANIWTQLKSGDNADMSIVVADMQSFLDANPPPRGVDPTPRWFGLTYINIVWQEKMVWGMLNAFAGSFLVVFLLMMILFRSPLWGLLCMVPLTLTIAAIYGVVGLIGKDYDMPVAVLSSLTLGLAVDFAIHFLARARTLYEQYGSWEATSPHLFSEPARAISRNIIIIAAGFLPLLLAPLVPYQTVGFLLATILLVSGVTTLLILPALIRLLEPWLFKPVSAGMPASCHCALCFVTSLTVVALILVNSTYFFPMTWSTLTVIAVVAIPASVLTCQFMSRRSACRVAENGSQS